MAPRLWEDIRPYVGRLVGGRVGREPRGQPRASAGDGGSAGDQQLAHIPLALVPRGGVGANPRRPRLGDGLPLPLDRRDRRRALCLCAQRRVRHRRHRGPVPQATRHPGLAPHGPGSAAVRRDAGAQWRRRGRRPHHAAPLPVPAPRLPAPAGRLPARHGPHRRGHLRGGRGDGLRWRGAGVGGGLPGPRVMRGPGPPPPPPPPCGGAV
mmetsp:Transcript_23776/g.75296  ORF Transcript_23776/g.75296 Transcript_23776/m.75296 type:complete len:209 (+) Transcript_23776:1038-1664(+)